MSRGVATKTGKAAGVNPDALNVKVGVEVDRICATWVRATLFVGSELLFSAAFPTETSADAEKFVTAAERAAADKVTVAAAQIRGWLSEALAEARASARPAEDRPALRNVGFDGRGLPAAAVADDLWEATRGWPRVAGGVLFVRGRDDRPRLLSTPVELFAWADEHVEVDWSRGSDRVSQERFFVYLRENAIQYEGVELLPHEPKRPGVCYLHPKLTKRPSGAIGPRLGEFLGLFCPATEGDRTLLLAAVLTPLWGGEPGARPAFLLEGPEGDAGRGRGVGKTRFVDLVAGGLYGGSLDVLPTEGIDTVRTRLLSPEGRPLRVCRLDNVKTTKLSWADLEGLITAPEVSGRQLYAGEGRRPNLMTWFVTMNGASLSKDLAQRVVPIRLARPPYSPAWEEGAWALVREHRWEILAEARAVLQADPGPVDARSRWSAWEAGVLARAAGDAGRLADCQALVEDRQRAADGDDDEAMLVRGHIAERLSLYPEVGPADAARAFIPSATAALWLSEALREPQRTNQATARLKGFGFPELSYVKRNGSPGFNWTGTSASPEQRLVIVAKPAL